MAKILSQKRETVRSWINERNLLPEELYEELIKKYPSFIRYSKFVLDKKLQNWGQIKGGKQRYNQLKRNNKFKEHHKIMLRKVIKSNYILIPQQSLFFKKIKEQNINILALLIVLLMTDGHLRKNSVFFTTTDKMLLNIFTDVISYLSKANIRIRLKRENILEVSAYDSALVKKLLKLSPTYKTSPKNQTKKDYLNGPQPTIQYLFHQNLKTKIVCVRLALSTDGYLNFSSESKTKFKRRAQLGLSCAHPILTKQWKELFKQVGLNCWIAKNKLLWAGIKGIASVRLDIIKKFKEIGGFAEGVKISKKSRFLNGYEKNRLLNLVCSYNTKTFKNWEDVYKLI